MLGLCNGDKEDCNVIDVPMLKFLIPFIPPITPFPKELIKAGFCNSCLCILVNL